MALETSPPSASSTLLPFLGGRSRRGSLASIASRGAAAVDKDVLAQALDDIHTEASKSETLTSFHDFDGEGSGKGPKELVTNGVTGIYHRLKQSVGSGGGSSKEGKTRPKSSGSKDSVETSSIPSTSSPNASRTSNVGLNVKRPTPDTASAVSLSLPASPVVQHGTANGDGVAVRSSTPKLHTLDGKPIPLITPSESADKTKESGPPPKSSKRAEDAPFREEIDRTRNAWADSDLHEAPPTSLARGLSHPEISLAGRPSHVQEPGLERAIDDSDGGEEHSDMLAVPQVNITSRGTRAREHRSKTSDPTMQSPPMVSVGPSHLPGFEPSRASSTTDGVDTMSISSSQSTLRRPTLEPSPNLNSGFQRRRTDLKSLPTASTRSVSSHLRRRVLSKDFWMKDDNAKVCFSCGQSFSTFRRKHHCRTCGQIFDAKCTILTPGRPFGQPGTVRLCRPCEEMIFNSDDDSTVFSDDDDYTRSPYIPSNPHLSDDLLGHFSGPGFSRTDAEVTTPSIGIPVSRRNREAKRRSAVIEFDTQPTLARPSSAHSLISLSRRPRSSSHRRRHSRHQLGRGLRSSIDVERGPFHQDATFDPDKKSSMSTFHHDSIIDPDLAAFLSDDGSDDEEQPSIMSAVSDGTGVSPADRDKTGLSGIFASALKKNRSKAGDKGTAPSSTRGMREEDGLAHSVKQGQKLMRNRNLSNGSMGYNRPSPKRIRSNMLLSSVEPDSSEPTPSSPLTATKQSHAKVVPSSALHSLHSAERDDVELYPASLEHVKKLLLQHLRDHHIPHVSAWEKALMPILLQCTDDVEPDVQAGDDMDIRNYIKLKKVPGGRPGDTSYVSGVVFSKNIALKTMSRSIRNPRIAVVTFAIEYARHEAHFMSLEPVIAQEQEYLENIVNRIAALRPSVLLVQKHVSGLALRLLEKAGITVAYNVKQAVLAAVARVTQTRMITSIDKLGIDPSHLGRCDSFEVRAYVSDGIRKSYIYLSGCEPDLGCTIVLRGADTKTLREIKRITEFMCYVAYNLKLENYLMRDEFVSIPHTAQSQIEAHDQTLSWRDPTAYNIDEAQKSIRETLGHDFDDEEIHFKYEDFEKETRKRILSASPFVVFMQPYMLTQLRDLERRLATYKMLRDKYAQADEEGDGQDEDEDGPVNMDFKLVQPEMVLAPPSKDQPKAVREYLHAVHEAQFEKAKHTYEVQERQWQSFLGGQIDPFDPFSHQQIMVLYSTVSSITSAPCTGPELFGIGFYAAMHTLDEYTEEDIPFGQYIEDLCLHANSTCKECNKKMSDHHRQYVHGYGQLTVSIQRQPAKMRGYADTILMWSTCRICRQETTVTPMSDHTWKYSFAKYLELSFWSSSLHPRAGLCKHDIHKDFLRCFGYQNMVVRFQYDAIDIYDVVVPRGRVTWKVEADLITKNEQYTSLEKRLNAFTESLRKRLSTINVDTLEDQKAQEAYAVLEKLRQKVEEDHEELLAKLQRKYAGSRYFELIPLNRALRFMDEKALEWDQAFNDFERDYFPSETDIRKLAALQLRNMFVESDPSRDNSDTEEGTEMTSVKKQGTPRRQTEDEIAQNALTSVVEEHKADKDEGETLKAVTSNDSAQGSGSGLTREMSPCQDQEQAVERNEVKHLDLAVSSQSPSHASNDDSPRLADLSPIITTPNPEQGQRDEPFATQPKPLSSGLLERIEQIRSHRAAGSADPEAMESKIPRLADLKKREASPAPHPTPPPLLRAQSQPGHVPRRSADLSDRSIDSVASWSANNNGDLQIAEKRLADRLGMGRLASKVGKVAPSFIPRSIPHRNEDGSINISSVSALAKHFETLSKEFEKERLKERRERNQKSRQHRANPPASSRPVVEVYHNATDAVGERSTEKTGQDKETQDDKTAREYMDEFVSKLQPEDNSVAEQDDKSLTSDKTGGEDAAAEPSHKSSEEVEGDTSESKRLSTRPRDGSDLTSGSPSIVSPPVEQETELPEITITDHKKSQWFNYLSDFWSKRSASGWANLEYPLHSNEHVFEDSDIVVREDEPSSIIALSLASPDYKNKVKEFRSHPSKAPLAKHGHAHTHSQASAVGPSQEQREAIEASLLSDTGTHMKYSFSHGPVKASCKIFYAESFDALRRKCGVADRFIESMSRCLKFDSKGGKTKSLFLRTLDNRFIIKSLQEVELKAFTKFAPDYFNFMSYALFHGVPSVIAKMFGVFQVNIRNPNTGVDFSYYLLVMENLFYERNPNRRFDLKGSMRNRKIESTGQADEVLLDENLVETIFERPLFVREHSRKLLQASVFNDTLWLCKQNVMDYSLMAGFDDQRKELIVGIIDCIRTYTWDKKLESWIKDRGKNKPTITSPKDYRNRFRVSMMQYVLQAPNCWHQFQAQMAPPKTLKDTDNRQGEKDTEGSVPEVLEGGDDGSVGADAGGA
ncbi:1-phosphatidylinositol-3-phosphate 5-kinase [Lecanosticta acicola]|uniref:1-phosphatidylinositol-3-phosphate 5-kinase n=1 Tax=Lecanosticta acicola TaxID=111012 RepID=A0AAI8Z1D5_9PEZI|nr:1-phosphatidylinositol-3-phosphate 5-kinase [Lecanosticta acicola]